MQPPKFELLGKGKSGYSYRSTFANSPAVLKQIHHEPCSYYRFDNKFQAELNAYRTLEGLGIAMPELLAWDADQEWLLKRYIDGPTAAELVANGTLDDRQLQPLFDLARRAQTAGLNLDYFPTNFVWDGQRLFYIDYEVNPYLPEWNLHNWGLFYWANQAGMRKFLDTGQHSAINRISGSGIPIKEPYIRQVNQWIHQFDNL